MSPPIEVRKLEASDIDTVCRLIEEIDFFQTTYSMTSQRLKPILEKALSQPHADLRVAVDSSEGGSIEGFIWVDHEGGFCRSPYLRLLAVRPNRARSGVGHRLMDVLEADYLNDRGFLLLVTESNQAAQNFYKKRGYRQTGRLENYLKPGVHELIFYKDK